MSSDDALSDASNHRSAPCYNCNDAFHITTFADVSFFLRCPRCFYHYLLYSNTIDNVMPPSQSSTINLTPPTTNFVTDTDDLPSELFNSTPLRTPTLKSFLDSLPSVKIHESSKSCSICLEKFKIDSEASQLPCKHLFHNGCIVPWLSQSNTCPFCRYKLPQEDEDDIGIGNREIQDNGGVLEETRNEDGGFDS